MQMKLLGITDVVSGVIEQRLIRFSISADTGEKRVSIAAQYTSYL
jgi:hypothetical protein